jgi:hypothetical protein
MRKRTARTLSELLHGNGEDLLTGGGRLAVPETLRFLHDSNLS